MQLKSNAKFDKEFRRIGRSLLSEIERALGQARAGDRQAVHEARKWIKRMRGLLRLYESMLGPAHRSCDQLARTAARALGPLREHHALDEAARLARQIVAAAQPTGSGGELDTLLALPTRAERPAQRTGIHVAVRAIAALRKNISTVKLADPSLAQIRKGAEATYRRARRALEAARAEPTADRLHVLRRHANYHRHHMRLLTQAWPAVMTVRANEGSRLHEMLGEERDLRILLASLPKSGPAHAARHRRQITAAVDLHCRRLHAEAMALAGRLFAERPARFGERIEAYWRAGMPARKNKLPAD